MKRPLAYITAAWNGEPDIDTALAVQYCRITYEAGFSPICPLLYLPLFMLRRARVLVVCGGAVDEDVKNDIAVAQRLNITATTLDGIVTVNQQGRNANDI